MKCSECGGALRFDVEAVRQYSVNPKTGKISTRPLWTDEREYSCACHVCGALFYPTREGGCITKLELAERGSIDPKTGRPIGWIEIGGGQCDP